MSKYGDLEQLGARLRGRRHELRRVQLDEVVLDPVGAQRVLERGLDAEDQVRFGPTQVEEAPVHALVDRRSRRRSASRGSSAATTSSVSILTSMPPSLTRSSCLSSPVTVTKCPARERRSSSRSSSATSRPSSPQRAGAPAAAAPDSSRSTTNCTFFWSRTVSTQPGNPHRPVVEGGKVLDRGACSHRPRVYVS